MSSKQKTKGLQRLLVGHGALLIFAGGLIGFAYTFFLMGHIAVWPIPIDIHFQMPGDVHDWHMAHMEALLNGMVVWLLAAILPLLPFALRGLRGITYGILIVAWTFVIASTIKIFFPNSQGLEASHLLSNNIVFALFLVGVVIVMVVMAVIAWKSLLTRAAADDAA